MVPRTIANGHSLCVVDGLDCISVAAYNTTCPQEVVGNEQFCNNHRAINLILLIIDSPKPFCVCTCGTECSTLIPMLIQ